MRTLHTDTVVIGSGIAGLTFALKAARFGDVLVITKKERAQSNTNWARGGIAAVFGPDDEIALHIGDTLAAGAGLSHRDVVEMLATEGPQRVEELIAWGTAFQRGASGDLVLGKEGGHSRRRIVHAADRTGWVIETALLEAVEEEERITVLENHLAVDFLLGRERTTDKLRCRGAVALDHEHEVVVAIEARATFLAAGGCGQIYRHTTNPRIATGDGVAMASRAGASVANMEFIQFHPTALYPTEDPAYLISEALRGEGAVLRTIDGSKFMEGRHPLGSLAPRDVVARAIDYELRERGDTHVLVDVAPIGRESFDSHFPDTSRGLQARGVDPFAGGIPVVPAAHYACGGVVTDTMGQTDLPGLWAAGEVSCTGVHGANRLASNSLLEAVVFSHRAARSVSDFVSRPDSDIGELWAPGGGEDVESAGYTPESIDLSTGSLSDVVRHRKELRELMWSHVGIVRNRDRLEDAARLFAQMTEEEEVNWRSSTWTPDGIEFRNMLETASLVVHCARLRRESRGLHQVIDHPGKDSERFLSDTVVSRPERIS